MNQRHLLALLQSNYTTVQVVFRSYNEGYTENSKRYTYKVPLTWKVEKDDLLLVNSPSTGLVVVKVMEVHDTPQIDTDHPWTYKWAVQKVDCREYEERLAKEEEFLKILQQVEQLHQKETLLEKFYKYLPVGSEARTVFDNAVKDLVTYQTGDGSRSGDGE